MRIIQKKMQKIFIIGVSICVVLSMLVISTTEIFVVPVLFIFLCLLVMLLIMHFMERRLMGIYRETIIERALNEAFVSYEYDPDDGFNKKMIEATHLFPSSNVFESRDYVRARINGVVIEFADMLIQQQTHVNKTTVTTTYFKGKWIIMPAKKQIDSRLYLIDRDNKSSRPKGWLFMGRDLEKVEMESIAFNESFIIYASDPHDAFYVVTPPVIEGLLDLEDHDLSVYQENGLCHVASSSSEALVKVSLFSSIDEQEEFQRVRSQLQTIINYVSFFGFEGED